jgi:lipopolysaccharide export system protein LptC
MHGSAINVRTRRWADALPGGPHDRLVRRLIVVLPIAIVIVAAAMAIVPLFPREEASLLLDRNKVAQTDQRIAVARAEYRGRDDAGRPFSLTVSRAVQPSAAEPRVTVTQVAATMQLSDGRAQVTAPAGDYDFDSGQVAVRGPVEISAPGGYRLITRDVLVDLRKRKVSAAGGVQGAVPTGVFAADAMAVDLESRTIVLEGNVRLRMIPGKLQLPR